ncbi:hypothetical protein [Serratia sp. UGAL515B_01]|uniref:hypothetical protein n=1 Tax=Serratia sp. UGAL515B_01 TaxID=2986763 RepID=UPI0039862FD9
MKVRLLEIRKDLTKIGDAEFTTAFEVEQKSWERYKNDRCKYITTGMNMHGSAYQFQFDVCNTKENYRRLETLVGDPPSS